MMISTRGRYALRVLIDLAEHSDGAYVPMKDVAERQDISLKYIEKIMPALTAGNLVEGMHGKGGGYKLNRRPEDYSVGEILRLTEGTLAPVRCLEEDAEVCPRCAECRTLPMWKKVDELVSGYLDSVSLYDLMKRDADGNEYVI